MITFNIFVFLDDVMEVYKLALITKKNHITTTTTAKIFIITASLQH